MKPQSSAVLVMEEVDNFQTSIFTLWGNLNRLCTLFAYVSLLYIAIAVSETLIPTLHAHTHSCVRGRGIGWQVQDI